MKKIFIVFDTQRFDQLYLLEYPFTEDTFEYIRKKFTIDMKASFIKKSNDMYIQDKLKELFLISKKKSRHFIFDIMIENTQYISYPTWIEKNLNPFDKNCIDDASEDEFLEDEKNLNLSQDEKIDSEDEKNVESNLNTAEKKKPKKNSINNKICSQKEETDGLTIEMFNIVFVFDKRETLLPNSNLIQNTYINLEVFSRYFLLEEYRKRYLSTEVIHIIKFYDNFFSKNNTDNSFTQFMNLLSTKTKLFKIINYLYCVIGKNEIPKINMTNADFKYYMITNKTEMHNQMSRKQLKENKSLNIKQFHSIIFIKPKTIKEICKHSFDSNPSLLQFITNMSPFKTIYSMSCEIGIEIDLLLDFVNCFESSGLVKKTFKLQNHSIFIRNPFIDIKNDSYFSPLTVNEVLEPFEQNPPIPIEKIYSEIFTKHMNKDRFLKELIYLLENEYIIQVSHVPLVNFEFRSTKTYEDIVLEKITAIINEKKETIKENEKMNPNQKEEVQKVQHEKDCKKKKFEKKETKSSHKKEVDIDDPQTKEFISKVKDESKEKKEESNKKDECNGSNKKRKEKTVNSDKEDKESNVNKEKDGKIYYEDVIEKIKGTNNKDYEMFKNIAELLKKKYFIEEISHFSGYKVTDLLKTMEKYPWLFNIIIIPVNNDY